MKPMKHITCLVGVADVAKVVGVAVMVYMGVVKAVHLGHAGNIL